MTHLSERIIDHYQRHALAWAQDRRRADWIDKPWHEHFLAALPDRARVLDLGCGGGDPVAVGMVERGCRVTGVDASPTLVSLCRARLPDETWIVADMRTLSLGERFDGILAWDSFFHLAPDDQRRMFEVFARHAGPAAVLMFNAGPAATEMVGTYRGDPLYHASLAPEDYARALAQIGFEILFHAAEDATTGGRTGWLARAHGNGISRATESR